MKSTTKRKPIEFYLKLKYPFTLYPDVTGGYAVEIEDLPGCISQGETAQEAADMIEEARQLWTESAYEDGWDIPMPTDPAKYNSKLLIRMPKSLHRKLDQAARKEGVSVNQFLVSTLSMAVGRDESSRRKTESAVGLLRDSAPPYKAKAKGRRNIRSKKT